MIEFVVVENQWRDVASRIYLLRMENGKHQTGRRRVASGNNRQAGRRTQDVAFFLIALHFNF